MENEILIALLSKLVDEKISQLPVASGPRGPRGTTGHPGSAGRDFDFSEHEETIRAWVKSFTVKFEDFTSHQIDVLRGPRGMAGADGKDFVFEDHEEKIREWTKAFALKFEDLGAEQIEKLRGPRGREGKDGVDGDGFKFELHEDRISGLIRGAVSDMHDSLRLKFSDLSESDISELRGPRGRDGDDGRDFIFDEHRDYFESLRLKFSDLSEEEKESLKLRFSQLTEDEKSSLKLQFTDLTDEDRALIRGPRGVRGQRGSSGKDGIQGPRGAPGPRGVMGLTGLQGRDGAHGMHGASGRDAPYIVAIDVEEIGGDIVFIFEFSDGSVIRSDRIELPAPVNVYGGGGIGGGGRGVVNYDTRIDEVSATVTYVGKTLPGNLTSASTWQIQKISIVGTETIVDFAEGNSKFDKIWDNRLSLSYA